MLSNLYFPSLYYLTFKNWKSYVLLRKPKIKQT